MISCVERASLHFCSDAAAARVANARMQPSGASHRLCEAYCQRLAGRSFPDAHVAFHDVFFRGEPSARCGRSGRVVGASRRPVRSWDAPRRLSCPAEACSRWPARASRVFSCHNFCVHYARLPARPNVPDAVLGGSGPKLYTKPGEALHASLAHGTNTTARALSAPCLATRRADGCTRCPPHTACPGWARGRPYQRARRSWGSGALPPCPRRCRWARNAARRASCCCLWHESKCRHAGRTGCICMAHAICGARRLRSSYGRTCVEEELGRGVPGGARDLVERGRHREGAEAVTQPVHAGTRPRRGAVRHAVRLRKQDGTARSARAVVVRVRDGGVA